MRVLHVNNTDLPGSRFNGYSMLNKQHKLGIQVRQLVLDKYSSSQYVRSIKLPSDIHNLLSQLEKNCSVRCLYFPYIDKIIESPEFQKADIVHFHLLHNEMFSLFEFPKLFQFKKVVWTIHDPWILTGHCVHPLNCKKYLTGCGDCPDFHRPFTIDQDTTRVMWKIKDNALKNTPVPLIVASDWMKNLITSHPFGKYFPSITTIPFGVDLSSFKPILQEEKAKLRNIEGIPNNFTIFFREAPSVYKGMEHLLDGLNLLSANLEINIITVGAKGILNKGTYQRFFVKEYGWINSEMDIAKLYQMSDLFVMPSSAESFGVMAIESLACGIPVLARSGTAVAEIVRGGEVGQLFEDPLGIKQKIEELYFSPKMRELLSKNSRNLAELEYSEDIYHHRLLELYDSILRTNYRLNHQVNHVQK